MSGYRTLFLLGWFFAAQVEHNVEGALIKAIIGPFSTEVECNFHRQLTIDGFDNFNLKYEVSKCSKTEGV